ncbi:hypothetical protein DNU06_15970 [Putridiphycobacter roseus]|uniref:Uncharacterized protein n=1 Tax=Putridiphycobacter roseus TaxID=2219161 RepID=A0A2W1N9D9_9FLAO|nr:hypothetical protein [Putridiphycobacter roseus]PZE15875.1 hypothetical protein DNU06_15970 [Putridiphycobacter roseus]
MKNTLFTLILFISNLALGQQYDGLHIEKNNVDKDNSIYTFGKTFVFNFNILANNSDYFIQKNETDTFVLTENMDSLKISEIHLTVLKPKLFKRTNLRQTEVLYSYAPNPTSVSSTGIVENNINIWMHPPRNGFFKSLETCPFPYIKLDKPIGYKWSDSMRIGNHWSDKIWGEWEGRLLLKYDYEIIGKEKIDTEFGKIDCIVVNAVANSRIGQSKLTAYFSEKYGFVKLEYTLFNGIKIDLNLGQIINGSILRDGKDFFENKYK